MYEWHLLPYFFSESVSSHVMQMTLNSCLSLSLIAVTANTQHYTLLTLFSFSFSFGVFRKGLLCSTDLSGTLYVTWAALELKMLRLKSQVYATTPSLVPRFYLFTYFFIAHLVLVTPCVVANVYAYIISPLFHCMSELYIFAGFFWGG